MKSIITIQHTESIHHTNGMVGSWTDWDLSELGIKQANNIGRNLSKELGNKKYVMYSSDLLRAKHTAKIIGKYLGVEPILVRELRERNLGRCVGKLVKWLKENIEKEEKSIDDKMFSDAESRRDEWSRLLPFFNELMVSEHENIIIVSHGDLLSVFNSMWLGMEVEMLNKSELFGLAGGVTFMEETASGKRVIKRMSDMSYVNNYTLL
ncbi:histidine phosphatase family protein [Clostridium perfringens]|nr:histidine phosphatase family protein [Clostridium perfringens]PWX13535.1 histidine phosphatase family protein [Clostridium perfringens]